MLSGVSFTLYPVQVTLDLSRKLFVGIPYSLD